MAKGSTSKRSRERDVDGVVAPIPDAIPVPIPGPFGLENRRAGARISDVNPAVYVADSEIHGLGMFATRALDEGVSLGRLLGMPTEEDGIYVLWLDEEWGLEVVNDFRFINHGKPANCELTGSEVVVTRPIAPDEELLHDYGW